MIVVVQTAFLGDLILSVPAIRFLKQIYPNKKIVVVCKKGLGQFLIELNICDETIEVDKGVRQSYQTALQMLNAQSIHLVACFHRSVRSNLFAFQIRAQKKISFRSILAQLLFFKTIRYPKNWPDVIRYLSLVSLVMPSLKEKLLNESNWEKFNFSNEDHRFLPIPDFAQFAIQKRTAATKSVAIFPGSVWATKRWTQVGFAEVTSQLLKSGYRVILMGSPEERNLCSQIFDAARNSAVPNEGELINLCGELSITNSILHLKNVAFVICNDSAAQHMAALVGTPSITIFGPTTLALGFRPWNDQSRVVQTDLDCRPCGAHGHHVCPLGHHNCMKQVTATQVLEQIRMAGL